jgi:hypothetical protein
VRITGLMRRKRAAGRPFMIGKVGQRRGLMTKGGVVEWGEEGKR